jgi:hypothetical protein
MGRLLGDRLPDKIFRYFHTESMTGVASTVDRDGFPRGAPMGLFHALDEKHLLMAVQKDSATFKNAVRNGTVALSFIVGGGTSFSIQGQARLFKETMAANDLFGSLFIEIESVKSDMDMAIDVIVNPVVVKSTLPGWPEMIDGILAELRSHTMEEALRALDIIPNPLFIVRRKQITTRRRILDSIQGRRIDVSYQWLLWDYNGIGGAEDWKDCVALLGAGNTLFIYDGNGDLKFSRPLDRFMFKAFEELIMISWFDDEMDKIYYSLDIPVKLDFTKLAGL